MLPKNFAIGAGIVTLSLAALFGFACNDDDDDANGDSEPTATEVMDDEGTPAE